MNTAFAATERDDKTPVLVNSKLITAPGAVGDVAVPAIVATGGGGDIPGEYAICVTVYCKMEPVELLPSLILNVPIGTGDPVAVPIVIARGLLPPGGLWVP
jgi:hypothetical protein